MFNPINLIKARVEAKRKAQFQKEVDEYNHRLAAGRARANEAMLAKWSAKWTDSYVEERKYLI